MSGDLENSLETIKAKAAQVFDPSFFGMYSFEYAYRLLLVYLSTNSTVIKGIRMSNPNAFDEIFKDDFAKAISHVLNYRGIEVSDGVITKLIGFTNETVVLFIKSSMLNPPQKISKTVAKSMDKILISSCGAGVRVSVQKVFCE